MAEPSPTPGSGIGASSSASQTFQGRISQLVKRYGRVAIGVHIGVYACFLTGCYVAVENHLDVKGTLERVGLMDPNAKDTPPEEQTWVRKMLVGSSSSLALAFIANKALIPVRVPITVALTPPVARLLRHLRGVA